MDCIAHGVTKSRTRLSDFHFAYFQLYPNKIEKTSTQELERNLPRGASLMVKNPCLPMQVQSLAWDDPTCLKATESVHHSHWACASEPANHNCYSPRALKTTLCNKRGHHNEEPARHNCRLAPARHERKARAQQSPSTTKNKPKKKSHS